MTTTDALFLLGLSTCTVLTFSACTYIPKWMDKMVEDKEGKGSSYYVMYLSFVILLFVLAFAYV